MSDQFTLHNPTYSADEMWERFVGEQSTSEFLGMLREAIAERGLRWVIQGYVDWSVDAATCAEYGIYDPRAAEVFRHAIAVGLIAHITASSTVPAPPAESPVSYNDT